MSAGKIDVEEFKRELAKLEEALQRVEQASWQKTVKPVYNSNRGILNLCPKTSKPCADRILIDEQMFCLADVPCWRAEK